MDIFGIPIWVIIPFVLGFIIFWLVFESLAFRKKLERKDKTRTERKDKTRIQ